MRRERRDVQPRNTPKPLPRPPNGLCHEASEGNRTGIGVGEVVVYWWWVTVVVVVVVLEMEESGRFAWLM